MNGNLNYILKSRNKKFLGDEMKRTRKAITCLLVGVIIGISIFSNCHVNKVESINPFFTLVFKTNGGGVRPDYGNLLRQHLARIGIDVKVIIQDWPTYVGEIIAFRDFDIIYTGFESGTLDPPSYQSYYDCYDENATLNLFGYDTSLDWDDELGAGLNEWYLKQMASITPPNSEERIQLYWDWEQYFMDKICPMIPTFIPKTYEATWANLQGYSYRDGLLQSWGKMNWMDEHKGQESTDEIVINDKQWSDLNPIFQEDSASNFISKALMDPLIYFDSDSSVWPHLAQSLTYLNDTTIEIVTRDGIKWNADFEGNFTNEYFDIRDVYFTLYAWKHVSNDIHSWDWIKDMEVIDNKTMRIYVDGDKTNPGNNVYPYALSALSTLILPEHYLNQTQLVDGITPDITHTSWTAFATHAFGTGLFEMGDIIEGIYTELQIRTDYWGFDEITTNDPELNWLNRFGDFSNIIDKLKIAIIPDRNIAIYLFKAGKLDIVDITDFYYIREEMEENSDFTVQSDLGADYEFFGFNLRESRPQVGDRSLITIDPTITKGLALRKAMSYAVDRNEINKIVHGDEYYINIWPINPTMGIWCNPNIIRYNFDFDKANMYMCKAGFGPFNCAPSQNASISSSVSEIIYFGIISVVVIGFNILKNKRKKLVE